MGELPHECPRHCTVAGEMGEAWAKSLGCRGPTAAAQCLVDMSDGTTEAVHECPHRVLRGNPEAARALKMYFGFFLETGCLPDAGGVNDQPASVYEAFGIIGNERGRIMNEKMKEAKEK